MPTGKLSVVLNHAQKRVVTPRIDAHFTASQIEEISPVDPTKGEHVWRIPECNAIAIRPSCLHPDWATQTSGRYAKLGLSDFSLSTGWVEHSPTTGAKRLYRQAATGAGGGKTASTYGINRGFYFSFFTFDTGSSKSLAVFAQCGWSNSGSISSGVGVKFWSDGLIEIFKGGSFVADYKLGLSSGASQSNNYCNIVLMPMRRRELLIYNAASGEAIIHCFADLDVEIDNNVITPNESLWFSVPSGQPDVEIAPLAFPTSVNVYSLPYVFGKRPISSQSRATFLNRVPFDGISLGKIQGDDQGYAGEGVSAIAAMRANGTTAFAAGDSGNVIVRTTLVSDSGSRYTPTIYGAGIAWSNATGFTDGSEATEILPTILSAKLDHADDALSLSMSLECKRTAELEATGILDVDNIPCLVKLGDKVIIDGYAESLAITDALPNDDARRVAIRIRDGASAMERYQYRSTVPLDYYTLTRSYSSSTPSAVSTLFRSVAIDDLDLTTETYKIAAVPPKDCSEFTYPIESATTPAKELNGLVDAFAAGYIWGVKPYDSGIKGYFQPPPSGSGLITIYATMDEAVDAEAHYNQTYYDFELDWLPIEGNEVLIQGIDPQTKTVITAYGEDAASKNPLTAPSSRPPNWCGEDRPVGYQSPKLTRQADVDRLRDKTLPIISAKRKTCSFKCHRILTHDDSDLPIWRGDMVTLDGIGTVPIASFSVEFLLEMDDLVVREASYVAGAITGKGARSRRDHRDIIEDNIAKGRRLFGELNAFKKSG